jgi:hypothetical protein
MLKVLNCVSCGGFLINLYLVIPYLGCTQDILMLDYKMICGVKSGYVTLQWNLNDTSKYHLENESKEQFPIIEFLTSRFIL